MGDCQYCPAGYWDCGPEGTRCVKPADVEEDRCHTIWVLLRRRRECCEAMLWVPEAGPPPAGWHKIEDVPIRVQTFKAGGKCVARVHVPECDVEVEKRCKGARDWTRAVGLPPGVQVTVNVQGSQEGG
jgi:hypothetical protein